MTIDYYEYVYCLCFFFKQKTAYEMRISDWSSDVCSSDLLAANILVDFDKDLFVGEPAHRRIRKGQVEIVRDRLRQRPIGIACQNFHLQFPPRVERLIKRGAPLLKQRWP